jgi:hypothetical protein
MPLASIRDLMRDALAGRYAVGYFESWNFESLQGVIDAVVAAQSPVIIGFNGEFMSHPQRRAHEEISCYGALGRAAAESAPVPCGFIFNECPHDDWVRRAVTAGFNLVMHVPAEDESLADYTAALPPSCSLPRHTVSRWRLSWARCPSPQSATARPPPSAGGRLRDRDADRPAGDQRGQCACAAGGAARARPGTHRSPA